MSEQNNQETTKKKKLTYDDVKDIVEYLVSVKKHSYTFGCYEADDIAQEIRLLCLEKLDKLDVNKYPTPDKWKNFLGRCVDNGLKNLKRDKYIRPSSYKKKYDSLKEDDKSEEAEEIREKYKEHQKSIKLKLAIQHPTSIDGLGDLIKNNKLASEMEYKELERHLLEKADDSIIVPLKMMLKGYNKVSKRERERVRRFAERTLDL